ncbi:alpha/beta fold hydrolase [Streptomyces olivaceiscleroticus]|uniref:AB hydrolase-1 domain-containing protein n=1 Tax=Streptomyces olivaceiscleroticus TaxID=68245 RepID=A0ABP3L5D9_9ACTN
MASVYRGAAGRARVQAWCAARLDAWEVSHHRWEVATDAGSTSVVSAGRSRDGMPLLVLVPGTNMNAAVALDMVAGLARIGAVAALDVPGQPGLSAEHRPRRARLPWYGHWLSQALQQVASGPAIVIGHSLGAAIALAAQSPHIVGRLLLSPGGLMPLAVPVPLLRATVPWMVRPSLPRTTRLLGHMSSPGCPVPSHLAEWMTLVGETCRSTLAPRPLPVTVLARSRAVPCTVAVGAHDIFLPHTRLVPAAQRLLGTEPHVLDDVGHLLLDNTPRSVIELVGSLRAGG